MCMSLCCHGNLCFERVIANVIKFDLYVKFPQIFAHDVQVCAKFCCKNFSDVCQVFRILPVHHYTWGAFLWTRSLIITVVNKCLVLLHCVLCGMDFRKDALLKRLEAMP